MKQDEVPQDAVPYYGSARRAVYATDGDGRYATVASSGWTAEEIVNADAVGEFEALAQQALSRARSGAASPLEYHMYARRMDLPTLAQTTGYFRFTVKRHLQPQRFARLSQKRLAAYADALGISIASLKSLP
jgi:hypothetical protein